MMKTALDNCINWPDDKLGRWTGHVHCLLIEVAKVTTIEAEREFTRPLFHKLYAALGKNIPASVSMEDADTKGYEEVVIA